MPQPELQSKSADKSHVPAQFRSAKSGQANQIVNSEPNSRLYIFNSPQPASEVRKQDVHKTKAGIAGPQNPNRKPAQASTKQVLNKNKIHPIKKLSRKFRKNGLGRIEAAFNARFFYYIWKTEKSKNPGKYYLYVKIMTALSKTYGTFADLFSPLIALLSEFFKPESIRKKRSLPLRAISWLAPVCAMAFTAFAIINIAGYKPELELWVNGEQIGLVPSRDIVARASSRSESNISAILGESYEFTGIVNYKAVLVKDPDYITERDAYNMLYGYSQEYIMSAYGLYIDGELVGATSKESDIDEALNQILEEITDKDSGEVVEFANEIQIIKKDYAKKDVLTGDEFKSIVNYQAASAVDDLSVNNSNNIENSADNEENSEEVTFAIFADDVVATEFEETEPMTEAGADIAAVAAAVSLSSEAVNTLPRGGINSFVEANDESILAKLARRSANTANIQFIKKHVEEYLIEIPFEVQYVNSDQHFVGTETVRQNGSNGTNKIKAQISYIGDTEISRDIMENEVITSAVPKIIVVGTKAKPTTEPTGSFSRPIKGGIVTVWFSAEHRAIDTAAPYGTSIMAADGGTVIYAGLSGSYGNHVKVRHSNGYVTLYAHMSSMSVKQGDKVYQGQELGKVGSTGRSTGNHLHFELIKNGVQVNPNDYIK